MRAASELGVAHVAILPTPLYFYGLDPGAEISVDLERGKTRIVRYVTRSEAHEDGTRTVSTVAVAEMLVRPSSQVDAKDLPLVLV